MDKSNAMMYNCSIMNKMLSNLNIELQHAEWSSLGKEWNSSYTCDSFARIYYVSAGSAQMRHGAGNYLLRPGHLYLIPPYSDFSYRCKNHFEVYWLHSTASASGGRNLFSLFNWNYEIVPTNSADTESMFKDIMRLHRTAGIQAELQIHGMIAEMLSLFIISGNSTNEPLKPGMDRFLPVMDYINENLKNDLSVGRLAKLVRLNRVRFSTEFHRLFGMPPAEYVRAHRIGKAQELLLNSGWKLDQIASELGFCDRFHFSRTFTRMTGRAPASFRDSVHGNIP